MRKTGIDLAVAAELGLHRDYVSRITQQFVLEIAKALTREGIVALPYLGTFKVKKKRITKSHFKNVNQKYDSDEEMVVFGVTFTKSLDLRRKLQEEENG